MPSLFFHNNKGIKAELPGAPVCLFTIVSQSIEYIIIKICTPLALKNGQGHGKYTWYMRFYDKTFTMIHVL